MSGPTMNTSVRTSMRHIGIIALCAIMLGAANALTCRGELETPPYVGTDGVLPQDAIANCAKLCTNNGFEHEWQLHGQRLWGEFVKVLPENQIIVRRYVSGGTYRNVQIPLDSLTTDNLLYVMMRSKSLLSGVDASSNFEFESRLETARAWYYLIRFSQNPKLMEKYLGKYNDLARKCRNRHEREMQEEEAKRQALLETNRKREKAERDRAEEQRQREREAEERKRELERKRSEIQGLVANRVTERVNEFLNAIYDGLTLSLFFKDDSSYKIFLNHRYFSPPARSWNIHSRILLGTPVNTIKTGIPMARVKVDYSGYTYNLYLEFSEATQQWQIGLISKITYVDSPPGWQEMPLSPFQSLLKKTQGESDIHNQQ